LPYQNAKAFPFGKARMMPTDWAIVIMPALTKPMVSTVTVELSRSDVV
jgi:hypothetical protein